MNVLFLHSNMTWGGGEVWLTQIVEGLSQRGHSVTVACSPGSALARKKTTIASSLTPLGFSGDLNPVTILRLRALIKRKRIDIVCAHTEKELRLGGIASLLAKVPLVVSREVDVAIKNTWLNRLFFGNIASAIIVNSHATKNTILISAPWLADKPMQVVWKGVDAPRYRGGKGMNLRERYQIAEGDVVAGFVGRLDEQKGISTLLEAMEIVVRCGGKVSLALAGEGNMAAGVERFRREHGLEKRIVAAGFVEDIPSFLSDIDFLVSPSNWEGFGYSIVEAMAAGKPVIASHVSSIPELVDHGRTGILVPAREPQKLAEAMITLSGDPSLRRIMGTAGRAKAENVFTLKAMVDKVEGFFAEIAGSRSTTASGSDAG